MGQIDGVYEPLVEPGAKVDLLSRLERASHVLAENEIETSGAGPESPAVDVAKIFADAEKGAWHSKLVFFNP